MRALAILFLAVSACDPPTARADGLLVVRSEPPLLEAWADDAYLGRTPIDASLPEGPTRLRIAEPHDSLFLPPAVDTLVTIVRGETLEVSFRIGRLVRIDSHPFGLPLFRDGEPAGHTPIWLRGRPDGSQRYTLMTARGLVAVPTDSLFALGYWRWNGASSQTPSRRVGAELPGWRRIGRYAMPVAAAILGVGGLLAEREADHSYERYREALDPSEISRHYDDARRWDAWGAGFWIGAEASLVYALAAWIIPDRRPEGTEETRR